MGTRCARATLEAILIRVSAVRLAAIGDLCDAYLAQHRRTSADVISMRMRDNQCVELVDAATQQERHDDAFADAFGRRIVALRPAFEPAARVDQERVTGRRLDDDGIGLSDVENRDAQTAVVFARRPQHESRCDQ